MEENKNIEVTKTEEIAEDNLFNFDKIIEVFDRTDNSIDKLNDSLIVVDGIAKTIKDTTEVFVTIKKIDLEIKNVEIKFEQFLKEADINLEKFKIKSKIVESQLDKFSNKLDLILTKAISIDTASEKIQEIELRTTLLTQVKNWGDTMSSILMKILAS